MLDLSKFLSPDAILPNIVAKLDYGDGVQIIIDNLKKFPPDPEIVHFTNYNAYVIIRDYMTTNKMIESVIRNGDAKGDINTILAAIDAIDECNKYKKDINDYVDFILDLATSAGILKSYKIDFGIYGSKGNGYLLNE